MALTKKSKYDASGGWWRTKSRFANALNLIPPALGWEFGKDTVRSVSWSDVLSPF